MKKIQFTVPILVIVLATLFAANAQENKNNEKIKPEAIRQIQALIQEKQSRTSTQKKIDSQILYTIKMRRGEVIADGVPALETGLKIDDKGYIEIDITAKVTKNLLTELRRINAKIIVSLPKYRSVTASVPLSEIESLAALEEVIFIMPRQKPMLSRETKISFTAIPKFSVFNSVFNFAGITKNDSPANFEERAQNVRDVITSTLDSRPDTGSVNSQGDTTHGANTFRSTQVLTDQASKLVFCRTVSTMLQPAKRQEICLQ